MTPENQRIIFLAGYSAAGKTSLGKELRDKWGYSLVEHQPLVHDLASSRGYKRARHWLAEVGTSQFTDESAKEMATRAQKILNNGETKIVFDVAYGTKLLEMFQREFPNIYILVVSIIAEKDTRVKNIQKRMGTESSEEAEKELHFRDNFLREVGLDDILQRRSFEVSNKDKPIIEVASELNRLIDEYLQKK